MRVNKIEHPICEGHRPSICLSQPTTFRARFGELNRREINVQPVPISGSELSRQSASTTTYIQYPRFRMDREG